MNRRGALIFGFLGMCGCAAPEQHRTPPTVAVLSSLVSNRPSEIAPAAYAEAITKLPTELTIDAIDRAILERNPTIEQMRAAAEAARLRYPQAISLDDPMFGVSMAPASAWSPNANFAARAEITQKLPFPGKRDLRGQMALSEASAADREVDDARLQLLEAGRGAFADYYLAFKALEVNAENVKLLKEFRSNAETRYRNGQAPQQDVLQADVELGRLQERALGLQRAKKIAQAKLNTLMHQPPDEMIPPPAELVKQTELPDARVLHEQALANRPDLKAISDRLAADEAALALALRDLKPDVELLAAYDAFWQGADGRPLQWQIGAKINLPVQRDRRQAAIAEARAKIAQRRAELAKSSDQIMFQVQEAYEQLQESTQVVELYGKTLMPAAEANIKEAQAAYTNGKIPFLSLVEAQRNLVMLRDRLFEAKAETVRRRATLDRAVGLSDN